MAGSSIEAILLWNHAIGRRDRALVLNRKVGHGGSFEDAVASLREKLDGPEKAALTRKLKSLPYLAENWTSDAYWARLGEVDEIAAFWELDGLGLTFSGTAWKLPLAKGELRLQRFATIWSTGWALVVDVGEGVAPAKLGEVSREELRAAVKLYKTWADCLARPKP